MSYVHFPCLVGAMTAKLLYLAVLAATSLSVGLETDLTARGQEPSSKAVDARLAKDRVAIDEQFQLELTALAKKCDELKLADNGALVRDWIIPRRYGVQYHFLPDFIARDQRERRLPSAPKAGAAEVDRQFWNRFTALRNEQADRLYSLARSRLDADRLQESFALLNEVLRENPDHAEARRILGYAGKAGSWSPQEREPKFSRTNRVDSVFSWAPNRHGVVDSAHFRIRTNADAKTAIDAANFLEECHDVWWIVYSPFWLSATDLKARFSGEAPPRIGKSKEKMDVILFASREEYVAQLETIDRNIGASRGYYSPARQTSYFYADANDPEVKVNWAHEITHQLFGAQSGNPSGLARDAHFWVVEGVAMYMESLTKRKGYFTTGGFNANRVQDARHRQRNLREHAALRELLPLGQSGFQRDLRIRQLYTAGAGYTHLLMDGVGGRYRDKFVQFVKAAYEEQNEPGLLEKMLGLTAGEIEAAYVDYLDVTDADLNTLEADDVSRLVLGRTSVTATGLAELSRFPNLRQLDLTDLTAAADDNLSFLAPTADLHELSLFGVGVTSACGERIAKMKSLSELNLSGSKIGDDIAASLTQMRGLSALYLSNTDLSDQGVTGLRQIKNLKELDLAQTKVTSSGVEELKKALPKLKITR